MEKLIVSVSVTGSLTIPTQTPYLPITPDEIADEAARAADAGAAIVHIHARDPRDGKPTADIDIFREIVTKIKEKTNLVICITTGGVATMTAEERIRAVPIFKPELATLNMGSMNFSIHPIAARYKDTDYRFSWEKDFLLMFKDLVYKNTLADLEKFCIKINESDSKPECEIYDLGQLFNLDYLVKANVINLPVWLQFVVGILGGMSASLENIMFMKSTADRLFGPNGYKWSVIGAGYPHQFSAASLAMLMGGHVRVGLEDNIFLRKGVLAKSNAELVEKAVRIARELDREIATPDEARKMLGLKGKDKVGF